MKPCLSGSNIPKSHEQQKGDTPNVIGYRLNYVRKIMLHCNRILNMTRL